MKQRLKKALPIVCCICISSMMVCGYIPPQDRKYLNYFLKLYAAQLFRDKNFVLVSSSCYVGKKNIERVEMELSFYRPMGKLKSRELIVDLAENLLEAINNDPILKRRGLLDVPFTSDRLIIEVKTDNIFSANADVETIKRIRLKKNTITYDTYPWSDLLTAGSNTFTEDYCVARMMCGKPVSYNDYENRHTYYKNFKNPDTPEGYVASEPDVVLPQLATVAAIDALTVPAEPFNSSLGNIEWVEYYSPFDTRSIENSLGEAAKPETEVVAPEVVAPEIVKPLHKERNKPLNRSHKPQQEMLIHATQVLNDLFPPQNKPSNLRQRTQDGSQTLIKDGPTSTQSYNSAEPQSKLLPISSNSFIADSSDSSDCETVTRHSIQEGCEPFFGDIFYQKNAQSLNGVNSWANIGVPSTQSSRWQESSEIDISGGSLQGTKLALHQPAVNHLDNAQLDQEMASAPKSVPVATFSSNEENRESGWVEARELAATSFGSTSFGSTSFVPSSSISSNFEKGYEDKITGSYFYASNPQKQIEAFQQAQFPESKEYQSEHLAPSTPSKSVFICFHEADELIAQQESFRVDSSEAVDVESVSHDVQESLDGTSSDEIPFETPSIVPGSAFPELALCETPVDEPDLSEEEKGSLLAQANIHADAVKRYAINITGTSPSNNPSNSPSENISAENTSFVCQTETALQPDQKDLENEQDKEISFFEKIKQFFFRPYGTQSNASKALAAPSTEVYDDAKVVIIEKQSCSQPIALEATNPPEDEDVSDDMPANGSLLTGDPKSLENSLKIDVQVPEKNNQNIQEEVRDQKISSSSQNSVSFSSNTLWYSQSPSLFAYISPQNDSEVQEMNPSDSMTDSAHEKGDSANLRDTESDLDPTVYTKESSSQLEAALLSADHLSSQYDFNKTLICLVDPDIVPMDSTLMPSETIEDVSPGMMQLDPEQKSALENTGAAQQAESSGMFSE